MLIYRIFAKQDGKIFLEEVDTCTEGDLQEMMTEYQTAYGPGWSFYFEECEEE